MPPGQTGPLPQTIGPYTLREKIGAGGMATVYRATDPTTRRDVAIKVMSGAMAAQESLRRRFEREANTLLQLQHPHILPVYDFGEDNGILYIVMRLLDGRSLADLLQGRPVPPPDVARFARQIAGALDYAHARGIIHRDIKPSNILLDGKGKPYLADFGVAFVTDSGSRLTLSGGFVGTAAYASPEQCRGETLDRASDMYSLGVMVFEMLTGQLPFRSTSPLALMKMHMSEALPSPIAINPKLPIGVYAVLSQALAKLPEGRYPSAMKFSEALDEALGLHAIPQPDEDDLWLRDPAPPQDTFTGDHKPGAFTAESDVSGGPENPFDDLFLDDGADPFGDFPLPDSVLTTDPLALPAPPPAPDRPPVIRPIGPIPSMPAPAAVPRRRLTWEQIGVYGTIIVSLITLIAAPLLAWLELRGRGPALDWSISSPPMRIALDYPAGWYAVTSGSPVLSTTQADTITLSDRPVPPSGPYNTASLVIAVQRINPAAVFGVPPACQDRIARGPAPTFTCMQDSGYFMPVYERFNTPHYQGIRLPGTLPPTPASWPIVLLPADGDRWLAVIVV
ncbi:MAG: serine/threonine protein kinase, partial [Anaerolineae bacterium]|nr:serine/threonine protein kinase [Anaerolineae bacterium]